MPTLNLTGVMDGYKGRMRLCGAVTRYVERNGDGPILPHVSGWHPPSRIMHARQLQANAKKHMKRTMHRSVTMKLVRTQVTVIVETRRFPVLWQRESLLHQADGTKIAVTVRRTRTCTEYSTVALQLTETMATEPIDTDDQKRKEKKRKETKITPYSLFSYSQHTARYGMKYAAEKAIGVKEGGILVHVINPRPTGHLTSHPVIARFVDTSGSILFCLRGHNRGHGHETGQSTIEASDSTLHRKGCKTFPKSDKSTVRD